MSPSCGTTTVTPGADRALADDERPVAPDQRRVADADAGDVGDRVRRPGPATSDRDAEVSCAHQDSSARADRRNAAYHRAVIDASGNRSAAGAPSRAATAAVRLEPLPELADVRPIDAAEALRDLPGLALLETARPGRRARWSYLTADPIEVLEAPAAGKDPFAAARRLRRPPRRPRRNHPTRTWRDPPPFVGGLVGYLGYDLGHALERLPTIAPDDQGLPLLRLGLHDWVVAWDRRTGKAWIGGRALDGDASAWIDGSPTSSSDCSTVRAVVAREATAPSPSRTSLDRPRTWPASSRSASSSPTATSTRRT